jgi:hypothetical protein
MDGSMKVSKCYPALDENHFKQSLEIFPRNFLRMNSSFLMKAVAFNLFSFAPFW